MRQTLHILALIVMAVQFGGCALTETQQDQELVIKRNFSPKHESSATLPVVPLTGETLYDLLVGEMAGQRGELPLSVRHYLQAAVETRDPRIAERATRISIYSHLQNEALMSARIWVETDPENLQAHQIISGLYMRNGDPMSAIPHLEKLLMFKDGETAKRLLMISNVLSKQKDKEAAIKVMETLLETRRDNVDALYAYGFLALHANKLELAEQTIDKVLALKPGWVDAIIIRARIYVENGQKSTARHYLEQAVDDNSDNIVLRLSYGRLLIDLGQPEQAYKQFSWLVEHIPENEDIVYTLAALALQTDRLDEAKEYFLQLASNNEKGSGVYFYLGQIAEHQQEPDTAITYYARITEEQPNHFNALIRISYLMIEKEGLDNALNYLRAIKTKQPKNQARLYIVEGEMLSNVERYEEAMTLFNSAITTMPDNNDLLYARAMLAEKMNKLDLLEKDLRNILARDAENSQALNALGYTLADRTTRYQEALNYVKRALELEPTSYYILDSMGWIYYRMGNYEEAVKYLRRAMSMHWDTEIAAHLGEVLWVKGDQAGAREVWDSALKKVPGDKLLLEVIKRFDK
ncbi:MAG: tetratricopeptide repeat protein [Gammaproteobacteria bacterium]|nr:tetratricopeptide repeat protein [Gammaproteobacteria bacterium]